MKKSLYKIGHVYIEIRAAKQISIPETMDVFQVTEEGIIPSMTYEIELADDILEKEKELLESKTTGMEAKRDTLYLFQTKEGECRRLNFEGDPLPYAMTLRKEDNTTHVWFRSYYAKMLIYETIFVSALGLEKVMIDADSLILHSAYMCYDNTAVLFSAPSGTGKSTQANLWEKYRGTYTVNGDKSLLIREEDGWYANGWPICGSSGICRNEAYPIRTIVILKQAKENKVYPLKGVKALRPVMEQITINTWDSTYQIKAMDQIEKLLAEVPIYCLECDISEDAVECLEQVIG